MAQEIEIQTDAELDVFLQKEATDIRALLKRNMLDIIAIGKRLTAIEEQFVRNKDFRAWVQTLGISYMTAENYMNAATLAEDYPTVGQYEPAIVYLLAAPQTPDPVVSGVITGKIEPSLKAIREAKREYSQQESGESESTAGDGRLTASQLTAKIIELVQASEFYGMPFSERAVEKTQKAVRPFIDSIRDGWLLKGKRKKTIEALKVVTGALLFAAEEIQQQDTQG